MRVRSRSAPTTVSRTWLGRERGCRWSDPLSECVLQVAAEKLPEGEKGKDHGLLAADWGRIEQHDNLSGCAQGTIGREKPRG